MEPVICVFFAKYPQNLDPLATDAVRTEPEPKDPVKVDPLLKEPV